MFKLIDPGERFQLDYRYIRMQSFMLDIEDVFAQQELQKLTMVNVKIKKTSPMNYTFQVKCRIFSMFFLFAFNFSNNPFYYSDKGTSTTKATEANGCLVHKNGYIQKEHPQSCTHL